MPRARAGVAVTFVMFITTLLITLAILVVWHRSIFVAIAFFLVFGLIDASFLSATLNKFLHGGWFPIALAGAPRWPATVCGIELHIAVRAREKLPLVLGVSWLGQSSH